MKKKLLALLIAGAMISAGAFALAGCAATPDDGNDNSPDTEQSETNKPAERPSDSNTPDDTTVNTPTKGDKTENKTEDDKKPDQTGDDGKTDEDKTDEDKKPDDSGDDKTVDQAEAFKAITVALQAKLDDEYGEGAEILTINPYLSGRRNYLGLKIKYGIAIKEVETSALINTSWLDKDNNITDVNQVVRLITNSTLDEGRQFVGKYFTDGNDIIAEKMIESRVGTDCDIIYGGVSEVTDVADDYMISNAAKFTVYALLADKDGKVSEYTETLIVTKDNGNVYDTVIYNRGSFRSDKHTQTELGALADNYYAVMQKKLKKKL